MPQPRLHASHAARQAAYRKRQQQARAREAATKGLPPLPAIATMPGNPRWTQAVAHARSLLAEVLDEMTTYLEDRSDAWRESGRAETLQHRMEAVQESLDALEGALT